MCFTHSDLSRGQCFGVKWVRLTSPTLLSHGRRRRGSTLKLPKRLAVSAACILSAISSYSQTLAAQAQIYSASVGSTNPSSARNSRDPSFPETNAASWHFELSPYLWFAGTHGTAGALAPRRKCPRHRFGPPPAFQLRHDGRRRSSARSFSAHRRYAVARAFGQFSAAFSGPRRDFG